jgi:hypothetical protein
MIWRCTYLLVPGLLALATALPSWSPPVVSEIPPRATPRPSPARPHPLTATEVGNATAIIDKLMLAELTAHGQRLNPPIDDATFVRRAYLGIIGRIPTIEEIGAFDNLGGRDRRAKLISALFKSPGRVHHEFTWWADLLRISTRLGRRSPGNAYVDWMKEQIRANVPYDQVVRALITSEGPALARGNGATGYYLRDAGMPLDNMANTVQVFLGTRVQCAQCHDHPFDKWTRREFFELAAYTNSVRISRDEGLRALGKKAKEDRLSPNVLDSLRIIGDTIALAVQTDDKSTIELPQDYQYHDAKPGEVVEAKSLFGPPAPVDKDVPAKQAYAQWLSSPENPRFTIVIANRLWKRAFGIGLIEPVDNFTDTTLASNPALMEFLSKLMCSLDYDLKRFNQIIYQTEAWQRAVSTVDEKTSEPYRFPGPILQRMSAEQLWDSMLTLAVPELDGRIGESAEGLYKFYADNKDKKPKQMFELAVDLAKLRERLGDLELKTRELRAYLEAMANKNSSEGRRIQVQLKELAGLRYEILGQTDLGRMVVMTKHGKGQDYFVRADELPSPASPGHFLRTFGQSDRDVIDGSNRNPATTQALTMLNGFIDRELLKEQSVLFQQMLRPKDLGGKVDALFLAILSRPPTNAERELGKQEIAHAMLAHRKDSRFGVGGDITKEAAQAALHNLAWVLLNGNEFIFVQ